MDRLWSICMCVWRLFWWSCPLRLITRCCQNWDEEIEGARVCMLCGVGRIVFSLSLSQCDFHTDACMHSLLWAHVQNHTQMCFFQRFFVVVNTGLSFDRLFTSGVYVKWSNPCSSWRLVEKCFCQSSHQVSSFVSRSCCLLVCCLNILPSLSLNVFPCLFCVFCLLKRFVYWFHSYLWYNFKLIEFLHQSSISPGIISGPRTAEAYNQNGLVQLATGIWVFFFFFHETVSFGYFSFRHQQFDGPR